MHSDTQTRAARRLRIEHVVDLADRQHRVVARSQLIAAGWTPDRIRDLLASGWLHRQYYGIFSVGTRTLDDRGRMKAGELLAGRGAAAGLYGAALTHDVWHGPLPSIDVVATRHVTARTDLTFHRARVLAPDEIVVRDDIRVTSIERTLVDLADVMTPDQLAHVMYEADYRHLIDDRSQLERVVERHAGRPRHRVVRRALELRAQGSSGARSRTETRLLRALARAGLPTPDLNVCLRLPGTPPIEVDFLFARSRVCIEVDGGQHSLPRGVREDARRGHFLAAAGYTVLRVSSADVWRHLDAVVALVAQTLLAEEERLVARLAYVAPDEEDAD